jgi:murein DD-endopeptidase MepM/ murein hydrolase activator NlpD
MLKKIFCKRKILVVTDNNILNVPLSSFAQICCLISFVGLLFWSSFSSGKYFEHKKLIRQKEIEVQKANLVNLDLQTKVDNLQGNLVRLNNYFDTVKDFDYNKGQVKRNKSKKKRKKRSSLKARKKLVFTFPNHNLDIDAKNNVVSSINGNTLTRISRLEKLIKTTGLKISEIDLNNLEGPNSEALFDFNNQGGPTTDNIKNLGYYSYNGNDKKSLDGFGENIERLLLLENFVNSMPVSYPMKRFYISSRYGLRLDPNTRHRAYHYGTDFAGPVGTKVYSTGPGVVKFAGRKGNYGVLVEIDHGYGVTTRYGHLRSVVLKKGDVVTRGRHLGYQGNTGRSTGPHLHYEIRYNNVAYNPEKFIKVGKRVF